MEKKLTFEEAIEKLEETANKLEDAKGGLEDTVKLYEEGVKLASFCNKMIDEAQQKITILSKSAKGMEEIPFDEAEAEE
jgi:exodeoxyribonuclease VII small subunit